MLEKDFNTIFRRSLDWGYKISDAGGQLSGQKPFDGFGMLDGTPIYFESKFLPKPMSFNLNRIEDHQIDNLLKISKLNNDIHCVIVLCVDWGRSDKRVFIFSNMEEIFKRRVEGKNFLKKELETLPYYHIKKGVVEDIRDTSKFIDKF